jgi:hypothetical protein
MLLKTHVEKMSDCGLSMMLMKTRHLHESFHDIYENKGTWLHFSFRSFGSKLWSRAAQRGEPQAAYESEIEEAGLNSRPAKSGYQWKIQ